MNAKPWTPDLFAAPGDDDGLSEIAFSNALSAWAWMQQRSCTVAEAALVFNTTPEVVTAAIDAHPWMFVAGVEGAGPELQFIEHDGA
ncbi:hypothetical protein [Xanthobacter flavus]|uniref:hypothetical protein n=1 Tax=Xanthobacter flavus TaxID=281 RepID=UPI00372C1ABC